jgi:hypothetical protein
MTQTFEERYELPRPGSLGALERLTVLRFSATLQLPNEPRRGAQCASDEVLTTDHSRSISRTSRKVGSGLFLRPVLRLVYNRTSHSSIRIFISQLTRFEQHNLGACLYCPVFHRAYRKVQSVTMPDADKRLRWMYLAPHEKETEPCGMRCWLNGWRADIYKTTQGEYTYYVSDCSTRSDEWFSTARRYASDVFKAMMLAENLMREVDAQERETTEGGDE